MFVAGSRHSQCLRRRWYQDWRCAHCDSSTNLSNCSHGPKCVPCGCDCDCCHPLLHLQVSDVPVNCIAFDQLGTRMFAGDASGLLTEVAVDLTPVTAMTAAAAAAVPSWSQGDALVEAGASVSSSPANSACGGSPAAGSCTQAGGSGEGAAVAAMASSSSSHAGAGGAALVASVLRNGSVATQQLAGEAHSQCSSPAVQQ